jgi:hypothetical protein
MLIKSEVLYDAFCEKHQEIVPIFHQPWWLEIVCQFGTLQKYVITDESESIVGIFPIFTKSKFGLKWQTCPPFCLFLGPILLRENQILFDNLMDAKVLKKSLYSLQLAWQPLETSIFWNKTGFETSKMFTYRVFPQITDEALLLKCKPTTRNLIRKFSKILQVTEEQGVEDFKLLYKTHHQSRKIYVEQNAKILEQLIFSSKKREKGAVFGARTLENQLQSAIFVVWDAQTMWHLAACKDDKIHPNDGHRLLIWEVLKTCSARNIVFDFEGGDVKGIGDFFASFGAEKVPFIRAIRYKSPLIKKTVKFLKNVLYPQHSTFH